MINKSTIWKIIVLGIFLILILTGINFFLSPNKTLIIDDDPLVYNGDEPVYVTLYSHNEDSWDKIVDDQRGYLFYRKGLLDRVNLLNEYGIEWDWQSDLPVVEAIQNYDIKDSDMLDNTNGGNMLVYMESLGVSIDPHVHTNSLADVAYVMNSLGVTPTGVIGGSRYVECGDEYLNFLDFISWKDEVDIADDGFIYGNKYPDAKWKPTILSVPAFGGHWFDDWSSGVWIPGDEDDFYNNTPTEDIIYIGQGYPHDESIIGEKHASGAKVYENEGSYIKELVNKIKNGEIPTGTQSGTKFMYTSSLHFRDINIVRDGGQSVNTIEGLKVVLDELEPLREAGQIEYVTYEQAADIWQQEYSSVPNSLPYESFSNYETIKNQAVDYCEKSPK